MQSPSYFCHLSVADQFKLLLAPAIPLQANHQHLEYADLLFTLQPLIQVPASATDLLLPRLQRCWTLGDVSLDNPDFLAIID